MADINIKEKELQVQPGDSLDVYQDHLRVVDKNGVSYRAAVDDVAKGMIERYRSSTLAGNEQSVEAAINGLNSQVEYIKSQMSQMLDFFHPVGSYYETSDELFDPNDSWGGTWVEEESGRVHIGAGGKYGVGDKGGEETHTLQQYELPKVEGQIYPLAWADNYASGAFSKGGRSMNLAEPSSGLTMGSQNYTLSFGNNQPHNNMQPYIVVKRWHRIA